MSFSILKLKRPFSDHSHGIIKDLQYTKSYISLCKRKVFIQFGQTNATLPLLNVAGIQIQKLSSIYALKNQQCLQILQSYILITNEHFHLHKLIQTEPQYVRFSFQLFSQDN